MASRKRKLNSEERRRKNERKKTMKVVFVNGQQKWVRREPEVDGQSLDDFIDQNADPIWLVQNEMWELLDERSFD